jgi:hypothetical protein
MKPVFSTIEALKHHSPTVCRSSASRFNPSINFKTTPFPHKSTPSHLLLPTCSPQRMTPYQHRKNGSSSVTETTMKPKHLIEKILLNVRTKQRQLVAQLDLETRGRAISPVKPPTGKPNRTHGKSLNTLIPKRTKQLSYDMRRAKESEPVLALPVIQSSKLYLAKLPQQQ